jgi:hypothetical protein
MVGNDADRSKKMSLQDVIDHGIKPCSCGEDEFLQVLPVFNKHKVHCVNCGNRSQAMSTKGLTVGEWNKTSRFKTIPEN